jgi:hypothetical protein
LFKRIDNPNSIPLYVAAWDPLLYESIGKKAPVDVVLSVTVDEDDPLREEEDSSIQHRNLNSSVFEPSFPKQKKANLKSNKKTLSSSSFPHTRQFLFPSSFSLHGVVRHQPVSLGRMVLSVQSASVFSFSMFFLVGCLMLTLIGFFYFLFYVCGFLYFFIFIFFFSYFWVNLFSFFY